MTNQNELLGDMLNEDPFEIVMRGYNRRQVDDYLIQAKNRIRDLEERFARANADADQLRREISLVRRQLAEPPRDYDELGERLAHILKLADQEAQELRRKAEEEVAEAREEAHEEAERLIMGARKEAERILSAANAEAEQTRTSTQEETERLLAHAKQGSERVLNEARVGAQATIEAAQRRADALNEQTERRVAALTQVHGESLGRLLEINEMLTDLLRREQAAGPVVADFAFEHQQTEDAEIREGVESSDDTEPDGQAMRLTVEEELDDEVEEESDVEEEADSQAPVRG